MEAELERLLVDAAPLLDAPLIGTHNPVFASQVPDGQSELFWHL